MTLMCGVHAHSRPCCHAQCTADTINIAIPAAANSLTVIRDAVARLTPQYGPKAVAFQFAQVGNDTRAQDFLARLDKDPQVKGTLTLMLQLQSYGYTAVARHQGLVVMVI